MYTPQQLSQLRSLPGAAQATEENSDVVALDVATKATQRVTELQQELNELRPKVPTTPILKLALPTTGAGHVRLVSKELDLLQKSERIMPEQMTLLKGALIGQDGQPLQTAIVSEDGTVHLPVDKVVQALELNKPAGVLKDISKNEPQPRQQPGGAAQGEMKFEDAVDAAVGRTVKKHYQRQTTTNNGAN
jgi:hypothetical protein